MKIKLLISRAGADFSQNAGDVIEVGADEGQRMIDAGQAELMREAKIERAVAKTKVEKATK
jgi:hypothetical protein